MPKFFINRPIVAMVIAILTVLVGLVCLVGLPISQYPNIVPPQIQVQATYPGADAMTVQQAVATPLAPLGAAYWQSNPLPPVAGLRDREHRAAGAAV